MHFLVELLENASVTVINSAPAEGKTLGWEC
jgi:hypothetical protein